MRHGTLGIEIGSCAELLFCLGRIAGAHLGHAERHMASGKIIVQTDRLVGIFRGQLHPLRIRVGTVLVVIRFAQSGVACRGLRIELDRPFQELDRIIDIAVAIGVVQVFAGRAGRVRRHCLPLALLAFRRVGRASAF